MWSISSWQNYYKSVFFSKAEWWLTELLFLSLNNWGLNFLQNECSQSSQIYLSPEKLRKIFTLQSWKFLNDKIDQNINFAINSQQKLVKGPRCNYYQVFWMNNWYGQRLIGDLSNVPFVPLRDELISLNRGSKSPPSSCMYITYILQCNIIFEGKNSPESWARIQAKEEGSFLQGLQS